MSKSSKSSPLPATGAARPFAFRPQDFGAPARTEKRGSPGSQGEESNRGDDPPSASGSLAEAESTDSAASTSTDAPSPVREVSAKTTRREEQTILMAVPPPAQENKGS